MVPGRNEVKLFLLLLQELSSSGERPRALGYECRGLEAHNTRTCLPGQATCRLSQLWVSPPAPRGSRHRPAEERAARAAFPKPVGLRHVCLTHGFIKRRRRSFLCSFQSIPPHKHSLAMAGLNVSIAFLFLVVGVCQALRWISKRFLSPGAYGCLARELAGSLQLCTSCLELRMLVEIGPWGGGFGPDVVLTLLFLLFVVHGTSFDGASANPTVSLQEFLLLESNLTATAAKLLAQGAGAGTGWAVTKLYWSWELTHFHLIQNLIASECSSSIRTSLHHAAFVEGTCSFLFHLVLYKLRQSHPTCRVPALAATVTFLTYTGEQHLPSSKSFRKIPNIWERDSPFVIL